MSERPVLARVTVYQESLITSEDGVQIIAYSTECEGVMLSKADFIPVLQELIEDLEEEVED